MRTSQLVVIPKELLLRQGWHRSGAAAFAAVIRWQSDDDGRWELETEHRKFRDGESAALFAAGYGWDSPSELRIDGTGCLLLIRPNGVTVPADPVSVRVLEVADDLETVARTDLRTDDLVSSLGSCQTFTRVHCYLRGPDDQIFDISILPKEGEPPSIILSPCRASAA